MKVKVTRDDKLDQKLQQRMNRAFDAALFEKGVEIMAASVMECPVDKGFLRGSAYVAPPRQHKVEIGYGKNYAIYVHERTELKHKSGKSHFLSDPVNAARANWESDMAKKIMHNVEVGAEYGSTNNPFKSSPSNDNSGGGGGAGKGRVAK